MPENRVINATCPDCRGPLTEVIEKGVREYRCLVEHRFSDIALLHAHSDTEERALWSAVVAREEAAVLADEIARHSPAAAGHLLRQAEEKRRQAVIVRGVLDSLKPFSIE
jgi:two-component system chemotaxis response regulator CheB